MTREGALLIVLAFTAAVIGLGIWGWMRRTRRDAGMQAPQGGLPDDAVVHAVFACLYVATTAHDAPLERLAVKGLAFRAKAVVSVADAGVARDLQGEHPVLLPADALVDVTQSTVAIDRVVEKDGLTRITWRIAPDRLVDTYLRPQDASARALADAVRAILPAPTPTGSDA
jgi:hypothetical protein